MTDSSIPNRDPGSRAEPTIGDLFARLPPRFGMRGDSYLWIELGETLAELPLPDSEWVLRNRLEQEWTAAVGLPLTNSDTPIYLARLDPGSGLSRGNVVPRWWHDTGLVLLLDRYQGMRAAGTA